MNIDDIFPAITTVLIITIFVYIIVNVIHYNMTVCDYHIEEPITTDTAKKLIDDSVKECNKNMCKFEFKIKKVKE